MTWMFPDGFHDCLMRVAELTPEEIARLPRQLGDGRGGHGDNCLICMEKMKDTEECLRLTCSHLFHA